MNSIKILTSAAFASLLLAAPALAVAPPATTFAQFTQQSPDKIAQYVNTGTGNTLNIATSPTNFVVQAFGPTGIYDSIFTLSAASSAPITHLTQQYQQVGWTGNIHFGDGFNFLDVNFADAIFSFDGQGGSASLISTDPNSPISFNSNLFTLPNFIFKNFSVAFSGLSPNFTVNANGFGDSFDANTAGTFAGAVPEPAAWGMLLTGFGLVGATLRRRRTAMATVTA